MRVAIKHENRGLPNRGFENSIENSRQAHDDAHGNERASNSNRVKLIFNYALDLLEEFSELEQSNISVEGQGLLRQYC